VLHHEPTPPTEFRSELPRDLETICLKCLEKEPNRRYASAGELAEDLQRFLEGQPVAALPLSASERLARLAAQEGFQIIEEIGRGPRSIVYRILSGPLRQPMALKVFSSGLCPRGDWEARIRVAADRWAALAHPHVVLVQRSGWWDGAPYVALEYAPQGSLAARLADQAYSVRQALRLVEQLAEIIRYLHRQGVTHGNLKPSNVLLAADGIPRVGDLLSTGGLFQGPILADNADPSGLGYLAPEMIKDPAAEPSPPTDIYGLGTILYELLTGRPPFVGSTAQETLEQVGVQDPIRPSQLNPDVTPYLEAICLRCLRKNPWSRFHRVYDLALRLRYLQENPEGQDLSDWLKRRPQEPQG
jgi:serine/threonine protein kinase